MFFINLDTPAAGRYDLEKFLEYTQGVGHDVLSSYFLLKLKDVPFTGVYEVTVEEGRPDLLAHTIYGNANYWWLLMEYNGFLDPEDIQVGSKVKYPALSDLETIYFALLAEATSA